MTVAAQTEHDFWSFLYFRPFLPLISITSPPSDASCVPIASPESNERVFAKGDQPISDPTLAPCSAPPGLQGMLCSATRPPAPPLFSPPWGALPSIPGSGALEGKREGKPPPPSRSRPASVPSAASAGSRLWREVTWSPLTPRAGGGGGVQTASKWETVEMLRAPGTEPSVLHRKGRAKGGGKSIEEGRRSGESRGSGKPPSAAASAQRPRPLLTQRHASIVRVPALRSPRITVPNR